MWAKDTHATSGEQLIFFHFFFALFLLSLLCLSSSTLDRVGTLNKLFFSLLNLSLFFGVLLFFTVHRSNIRSRLNCSVVGKRWRSLSWSQWELEWKLSFFLFFFFSSDSRVLLLSMRSRWRYSSSWGLFASSSEEKTQHFHLWAHGGWERESGDMSESAELLILRVYFKL